MEKKEERSGGEEKVDRCPTVCVLRAVNAGSAVYNPDDPVSGMSGIPRNMTGEDIQDDNTTALPTCLPHTGFAGVWTATTHAELKQPHNHT